MRRVAMLLSMVGVMALGLAATPAPAQAQDGWWGYSRWRQHEWRERAWRRHEWREHHYWRPQYYRYGYYYAPPVYYTPGVTIGFNFR